MWMINSPDCANRAQQLAIRAAASQHREARIDCPVDSCSLLASCAVMAVSLSSRIAGPRYSTLECRAYVGTTTGSFALTENDVNGRSRSSNAFHPHLGPEQHGNIRLSCCHGHCDQARNCERTRSGGHPKPVRRSPRDSRGGFKSRKLNVGCWHKADLQRARLVGPLTGSLPTFGVQCRLPVRSEPMDQTDPRAGSGPWPARSFLT